MLNELFLIKRLRTKKQNTVRPNFKKSIKFQGNEQDAAWDWLAENSTNNVPSSTSVDASWHLLKELVLALEKKGQTGMKKAVATRLLTLNTALPAWLITGELY